MEVDHLRVHDIERGPSTLRSSGILRYVDYRYARFVFDDVAGRFKMLRLVVMICFSLIDHVPNRTRGYEEIGETPPPQASLRLEMVSITTLEFAA